MHENETSSGRSLGLQMEKAEVAKQLGGPTDCLRAIFHRSFRAFLVQRQTKFESGLK